MLAKYAVLMGFSIQVWALNVLPPVTVSEIGEGVKASPQLIIGDNGTAAVLWIAGEGREEILKASIKVGEDSWSSPQTLTEQIEMFVWPPKAIFDSKQQLVFPTLGALTSEKLQNIIPASIQRFELQNSAFTLSGYEFNVGACFVNGNALPAAVTKSPTDTQFYLFETSGALWSSKAFVATNHHDTAYVAWLANNHTLYGSLIRKGEKPTPPEKIYDSLSFLSIWNLQMVLDEQENVTMAFENNDTVAVLSKKEGMWSDWITLSDEEDEVSNTQIALDKEGNIMVAWEATTGTVDSVKAAYLAFGEEEWHENVEFIELGTTNWHPEVRTDHQGNFVLIWQQEHRRRQTLFGAMFSTSDLTWTPPQQLSPPGLSFYGSSFDFSPTGKGYISWVTTLNGFDDFIQVGELKK